MHGPADAGDGIVSASVNPFSVEVMSRKLTDAGLEHCVASWTIVDSVLSITFLPNGGFHGLKFTCCSKGFDCDCLREALAKTTTPSFAGEPQRRNLVVSRRLPEPAIGEGSVRVFSPISPDGSKMVSDVLGCHWSPP